MGPCFSGHTTMMWTLVERGEEETQAAEGPLSLAAVWIRWAPCLGGGFFLGGSGLRGIWEELTAVADRPSTHTRDVLAGFEAVVNYGRGSPTCSLFQRQLEESSILPLILPDFAE